MSAPAGLCESCGLAMQWTFSGGELWVRCPRCTDLFGTDLAGDYREGREAVMAGLSLIDPFLHNAKDGA